MKELQESNLIVVAGSPNSGRTTLARILAETLFYSDKDNRDYYSIFLFYSTILSSQELNRFTYDIHMSDCLVHRNFSGNLTMLKHQVDEDIIHKKEHLMCLFGYTSGYETCSLNSKSVLVLDMFHFLDEPLLPNENETVRISKIITELVRIAKELNLVIICTSEVNMESIRKKRKDLLCLRDSIKIGSIADAVYLIDDDYVQEDSLPFTQKKAINLKNRFGLRQNIYFQNKKGK